MLLYCKFICSLSVERQVKALHQNQSEKHRNTHRGRLNSKYQSISPMFFVKLASPLKRCHLELPEDAAWYVARMERESCAESLSLTVIISVCAYVPAWSGFIEVSGWGLADIEVLEPVLRAQNPYAPSENWAHIFFLLNWLFFSDLSMSHLPAGISVAYIVSADSSL